MEGLAAAEPRIKLENYYGPLDLLLHLIREDELDILDIRLREVVDQYIAFLNAARDLNVDVAGEFIALSSQLLLLKSRRVVPAMAPEGKEDEGDEEEISVELIRKLLEYKKFKDLAKNLEQAHADHSRRHGRPPIRIEGADEEAPPEVDLWKLVKAFARLSQQIALTAEVSIIYQDIPIETVIRRILDQVTEGRSVPFGSLVQDPRDRAQVIGALLAVLELCRQQVIEAKQVDDGGDILLRRRAKTEEAPADQR